MKIVIRTKNLKLTPDLEKYIEEKLNRLEKFVSIFQNEKYYDHFFSKGKPTVEAWVEIRKDTLHHQKGHLFWAECQIRFPKKSVRATCLSENLKMAINEVKEELEREFKEYKEKIISLTKRRARALKKELHLSPAARFYRKGRIREEGI